MSLLDTLRLPGTARRYEDAITAAATQALPVDPSSYPIASPWAPPSHLERVVYEDVFGTDAPLNTRGAAMRIPAVARARNLLVSTIARFPLVAFRGVDERLEGEAAPPWLSRTDRSTSPQLRLAWTVDDLVFYGWSCWQRTNRGDTGFPLTYDRVPFEAWEINDDNRVEINGVEVDDDEVTLIPGLHEGVLAFGYDALSDARVLYRNVRQRLTNPVPGLELHQTGGAPLTNAEIDTLIARWAAARAGQNGGVAYTSEAIETKELGAGGEQLLIEARNAASLDLARVVGVAASRIDATAPKSTLNYETTQGRNLEFTDFDLALYMTPITARLSLDDVVPRGQRIAFDSAAFTAPALPPTGPNLED